MQLINTDFYAGLVDSLSMEGVNEKKKILGTKFNSTRI